MTKGINVELNRVKDMITNFAKKVEIVSGNITYSLILKSPERKAPFYRILWRAGETKYDYNNRTEWKPLEFWYIPATIALKLFIEAEKTGMFQKCYHRWTHPKIEVLDSETLDESERIRLKKQTLNEFEEDQVWRLAPDLRIVACNEPGEPIWRKVMILSASMNYATFRSITYEGHIQIPSKFTLLNGWRIHNIIMDADVFIHLIHMRKLKDAISK